MGLAIAIGGASMAGGMSMLSVVVGLMARKVGQQNGRVTKMEKTVGDFVEANPIERIKTNENYIFEVRSMMKFGRPAVLVLGLYLTGTTLPDLLKLIETEGDVVAGTYRFKHEPEEYMGALMPDIHARPQVRPDGCVKAHSIPAGFLKITAHGVNVFMREYPELCYGDRFALCVDLFNHGAHEGVWYGEDDAFARRWREKCGDIWVVPDLNLTHHTPDTAYPGNFHRYLLRQDGGSDSANAERPK
jgi:hypothetical protein